MATIINHDAVVTQNIDGFLPSSYNLDVVRLDLCHPIVSGNKWFKLSGILKDYHAQNKKYLISFGGGWSNHLVALAFYTKYFQIPCKAFIRGHYEELTPSLQYVQAQGVELIFLDRAVYDQLKNNPDAIATIYPEAYYVPEGGNSSIGVQGAQEIAEFLKNTYDYVCVSVGSGTTFAGLRRALPAATHLLGFVPMKQGAYLGKEIASYLPDVDPSTYTLIDTYHFGGFGKCTPELIAFMNTFYKSYAIPLDRVYTAKMMMGIRDMVQLAQVSSSKSIAAIHTGGLQGNQSINAELVF